VPHPAVLSAVIHQTLPQVLPSVLPQVHIQMAVTVPCQASLPLLPLLLTSWNHPATQKLPSIMATVLLTPTPMALL
jgi:hypothetical protein